MIQRDLCHPKSFGTFEKRAPKGGLCKVRMRTADADGGWRMADGGRRMADGRRRTDKKKIIIKKNDMKNNKLIIEIVGQLMPFK